VINFKKWISCRYLRSLSSALLPAGDVGQATSSGVTVSRSGLTSRTRQHSTRLSNAPAEQRAQPADQLEEPAITVTVNNNRDLLFGPSAEQLDLFYRQIYDRYHEEKVVCSVCDEICRESETEIFTLSTFPGNMFKLLLAPNYASTNPTEHLHTQLLSQYSVAEHFLEDERFQKLLLSPRGIERNVKESRNVRSIF